MTPPASLAGVRHCSEMANLRSLVVIGATIVGQARAQQDPCQVTAAAALQACCGGQAACLFALSMNPALASMDNQNGWCHQAACTNALHIADTSCAHTSPGNAAAQAYTAMRGVVTCAPDDPCVATVSSAIMQPPCSINDPTQLATQAQAICMAPMCKQALLGLTTGSCASSGSLAVQAQMSAIQTALAACNAGTDQCSPAAMISVGAACCPGQHTNGQQSLTCTNPSCANCISAANVTMRQCPVQFMNGDYTTMLGNCGSTIEDQIPATNNNAPCPAPAIDTFRATCCSSGQFPCTPTASACTACGATAQTLMATCATSFLEDNNNQAVLTACSSQVPTSSASLRCFLTSLHPIFLPPEADTSSRLPPDASV